MYKASVREEQTFEVTRSNLGRFEQARGGKHDATSKPFEVLEI
jgi:hypothetical protein